VPFESEADGNNHSEKFSRSLRRSWSDQSGKVTRGPGRIWSAFGAIAYAGLVLLRGAARHLGSGQLRGNRAPGQSPLRHRPGDAAD
jgi:hypothetical protein